MTIAKALISSRVGDLPEDFHATVEVDGYEIMIITERQVTVTVTKKRSPGKLSRVVIHNPDPDLTVEEVFRRARETLEALVHGR
jgi:hypothetical protein